MTIEMVLRYGHQCIPIELRSFNVLQSQGIPEGGKRGQVLKKRSDKDYDADWQDDSQGTGGTIVTINGEAQDTFPADTYVAALVKKLHGELVDNAPEALDTLYELAKALGDDPNFATTVLGLIGGKVEKTTLPSRLYGTASSGAPYYFGVSQEPVAEQMAFRTTGGQLRVGKADLKDAAVPLGQLNTILDERIGDISAALDEIIKLQEQFLVNNLFNLSALADDPTVTVNGESLYVDPSADDMYNRSVTTEKTLKEVCPQVEAGKTYRLSWKPLNGPVSAAVGYPDPQRCIVPAGAITGNPLEIYPNGEFTFTCTEQMLGRGFEIYSQYYDDGSLEGNYAYGNGVTFTDIMLTEV